MEVHHAPPSLGFSRQEHWSGLPFPSPDGSLELRKPEPRSRLGAAVSRAGGGSAHVCLELVAHCLGSATMPGMRAVFLCRILIEVAVATGETSCNPGEYEVPGDLSCSRFCPAGYYVSRPINQDHHIGACSQCESGTFRAHPNEQTQCTPCAQCREDQEVVKHCSATSDRECQCKQGKFYCDSVDCRESCFRCTRCHLAVGAGQQARAGVLFSIHLFGFGSLTQPPAGRSLCFPICVMGLMVTPAPVRSPED
uniref:TNFR-Cys domain-containing protein n=1 Tax=Bos indicus x Bos taurus TaxID=30522 RepID=A0A4W2IEK9_BOBOX